jgi:hypothetical protein
MAVRGSQSSVDDHPLVGAGQPELLATLAELCHAMRKNFIGNHQKLLDDNYYPLSSALDLRFR